MRTPLIVDVDKTPEAYLGELHKPARKNWRAAQKANASRIFKEIDYDPALVRDYMQLWEEQSVDGHKARWVFGPGYFDDLARKGWLRLFALDDIALHPVEQFGEFLYTQPVLYEKELYPEAAKFMWFNLMFLACDDPLIRKIDLGGGFHGSWRDFLYNRADPKFAYKWQFVSKQVKDDPSRELPWFVQRCVCGHKQLVMGFERCQGCGGHGPSG